MWKTASWQKRTHSLKILFIHTNYIERGGEDIVYENEVRLMQEAGYETHSLLFNNKRYAAIKFFFFFFNPISWWQARRAIRRFKPDIVHIHNWFFAASPSVFIAARQLKVPVVHTIHNFRILCPSSFLFFHNELFTICMTSVFPIRAVTSRIYRNSAVDTAWLLLGTRLHYLLRTWQHIDKFICLTKTAAQMLGESLLKVPPGKIAIKPNFICGCSDKPPVTHTRKDFLYVGRLSPEKGITLLLDSFRNSPFTLRIIGDGPLRKEVEACIAESPNILYLGRQEKQQIFSYLRESSALVFTTVGFEQFGLAMIEAFSCGTPVIGPDTGSPAEIIIENYNGLHFRTGSVPDLRQKIQYYQSLPESTRQSFSENATASYRKHYTPQTNLRLLSNIYKSVLHENNADL